MIFFIINIPSDQIFDFIKYLHRCTNTSSIEGRHDENQACPPVIRRAPDEIWPKSGRKSQSPFVVDTHSSKKKNVAQQLYFDSIWIAARLFKSLHHDPPKYASKYFQDGINFVLRITSRFQTLSILL